MHSYLHSIGFSNCKTSKDMKQILNYCLENAESKKIIDDEESVFIFVEKQFGENFGIHIFGEYNDEEEIEILYYYPYFQGYEITTQSLTLIEKLTSQEAYAGVCEDYKVGVSIIFYLQNIIEFKNSLSLSSLTGKTIIGVILTGISSGGIILLPISKNENQEKNSREASVNRMNLIAAARDGDEDAIESLTLEDINTYSMVSRRILNEDIFTIVETYFMPYGIECDQYTILGIIEEYDETVNYYTNEEICILTLNCNDLHFNICVNKKDLVGEPMIGRRFKGNIWLQGKLIFEK